MVKRTKVKKNDLIQVTDGDNLESYSITAEDFAKQIAGNFDLLMRFMKAIEQNQKLLNIRMNEYHPVTEKEVKEIKKRRKNEKTNNTNTANKSK